MGDRLRAAGVLAAALIAASPAAAQRATWAKQAGQARTEDRSLETSKGLAIAAQEGWIAVPERRGDRASRLVEVHYLRLRSTAASPRAPLVYLSGGPGSTGVSDSPRALDFWTPILAVSDVVLFDQRGTRDPDLRWTWDGPPPLDYFRSANVGRGHIVELCRRAAAAIRARGVDLAGYNTIESADDVEELRRALGVPKLSLLGFSYGTHLGTAFLRRHGAVVENAVLIGMEGPDHTYKQPLAMDTQLRKLSAMAAADPGLEGRVPDLMALLDRVDAKLEREPIAVKIPGPDGGSVTMPVGSFGLRFILRADVGDATDLPVFPRLLWSLDRGDPSILKWFVAKRSPIAVQAHGMGYATDAASGWSPGRKALIESQTSSSRFADVVNFPFPDVVAAWGVPDVGDEFRSPLVSSVRTLFVSGELDWNTPPYQAEELKWGFSNATHLVVANAGHEQTWLQNPETMPVLADFLAGKDVSGRRLAYPALRFIPLEGSDPKPTHPSLSR